MDLNLTHHQIELRNRIRAFVEKELQPTVAERDDAGTFDRWVFDACVRAGLAGLPFPEQYCGGGGSILDYVIALEEVGRVELAQVLVLASHIAPMTCIMQHGTEEQKERWLAPMCRGEKLGCFSITEPGAGSDAASMKSQAVRDGDYFVLNGRKTFATNSGEADTYVIFVSTDLEAAGRGVSAFIVEKGTPGLRSGSRSRRWACGRPCSAKYTWKTAACPPTSCWARKARGCA